MTHDIRDTFANIQTWIFDLDHTLYPPDVPLFAQMEVRMVDYMCRVLRLERDTANALRANYWRDYGTTLAGLMAEYQIDPDPFLWDVHQLDFSVVPQNLNLRDLITRLDSRKIIYTNGTAPYAEDVIAARGIGGVFDAIYGVEHANYLPKPNHAAFEAVFSLDGFDRAKAVMFEDDPRNLKVPKEMGLTTVLISSTPNHNNFIDYQAPDLEEFLSQIN
jgi:putative hydrolase of the HAD superfamily